MNRIQEDVRCFHESGARWDRVASSSISHDVGEVHDLEVSCLEIPFAGHLRDQILKNKWSLGDIGARYTKEAAAAADEANDKKTNEQVRR